MIHLFFIKIKIYLFKADDIDEDKILESETRNYRKKLNLNNDCDDVTIKIDSIDNNIYDNIFELTTENVREHNNIILEEEYSIKLDNVIKKKCKKNKFYLFIKII